MKLRIDSSTDNKFLQKTYDIIDNSPRVKLQLEDYLFISDTVMQNGVILGLKDSPNFNIGDQVILENSNYKIKCVAVGEE